jgi:hypothetical protein
MVMNSLRNPQDLSISYQGLLFPATSSRASLFKCTTSFHFLIVVVSQVVSKKINSISIDDIKRERLSVLGKSDRLPVLTSVTKFYLDDLCRTRLLAIFAHNALTDVRYKSLIGVIIKIDAIRGTSKGTVSTSCARFFINKYIKHLFLL